MCWCALPKVNDNLTKVSILAQAQLGCLAIDDAKCPGLMREAARIMQGPNLIGQYLTPRPTSQEISSAWGAIQ